MKTRIFNPLKVGGLGFGGFRVQGSGFRVHGSGFNVQGSGYGNVSMMTDKTTHGKNAIFRVSGIQGLGLTD